MVGKKLKEYYLVLYMTVLLHSRFVACFTRIAIIALSPIVLVRYYNSWRI